MKFIIQKNILTKQDEANIENSIAVIIKGSVEYDLLSANKSIKVGYPMVAHLTIIKTKRGVLCFSY